MCRMLVDVGRPALLIVSATATATADMDVIESGTVHSAASLNASETDANVISTGSRRQRR